MTIPSCEQRPPEPSAPTRRHVLVGGGALAAAGLLGACGSNGGDGGSQQTGSPALKTSEVPVGGGTILTDARVVVTQPTAGDFKAFTAICTHQGCTVSSIRDGAIRCGCHGSSYSVTDGSVITGPATRALAARTVTISGDTLTVG